jgi:hypothetical protein
MGFRRHLDVICHVVSDAITDGGFEFLSDATEAKFFMLKRFFSMDTKL